MTNCPVCGGPQHGGMEHTPDNCIDYLLAENAELRQILKQFGTVKQTMEIKIDKLQCKCLTGYARNRCTNKSNDCFFDYCCLMCNDCSEVENKCIYANNGIQYKGLIKYKIQMTNKGNFVMTDAVEPGYTRVITDAEGNPPLVFAKHEGEYRPNTWTHIYPCNSVYIKPSYIVTIFGTDYKGRLSARIYEVKDIIVFKNYDDKVETYAMLQEIASYRGDKLYPFWNNEEVLEKYKKQIKIANDIYLGRSCNRFYVQERYEDKEILLGG